MTEEVREITEGKLCRFTARKHQEEKSRHAPPPISTAREKHIDLYTDDSGSQINSSYHHTALTEGSLVVGRIAGRENSQRGEQGIHQAHKSTLTKPRI